MRPRKVPGSVSLRLHAVRLHAGDVDHDDRSADPLVDDCNRIDMVKRKATLDAVLLVNIGDAAQKRASLGFAQVNH
jgi:hypothetical protein